MVEFVVKVIDPKDRLHPDRWPATISVAVVWSTSSTAPDGVAFNRQVGLGVAAPIRNDVEPEHAGIEVGRPPIRL